MRRCTESRHGSYSVLKAFWPALNPKPRKLVISRVIIRVTPFRALTTLLITYLLSPLPLQVALSPEPETLTPQQILAQDKPEPVVAKVGKPDAVAPGRFRV